MQTHQAPCIILRARPFQENTRILTFITPSHGVLKGFARGGMRPHSPRAGAYEPLICGIMHFSTKETSEMVSLQKCDPHPPYVQLCNSYEKICFASHFAALTECVPITAEGYVEAYQLLLDTLQGVLDAPHLRLLPLLRLRFELKWLQLLGFAPLWERCANCNAPTFSLTHPTTPVEAKAHASNTVISVRRSEDHQFDASLGGMRCPDCVLPANPHCTMLPASALAFLVAWQGGAGGRPTQDTLQRLLGALTLHVVYQLESEPPSLRMLPPLDTL